MNRFIPIIFLLLSGVPAPSFAQNWLAADHIWTYSIMGGFAGVNDLFNLQVGIDTVIKGQPCKKMLVTGSVIGYPGDRYAYAEGDRVFAYQTHSDSFVKLYDFTLGIGDTVYVPTQFGEFHYQIEALDTVQAGPLWLRRQKAVYLNNGAPTSWTFDILESIGMAGRPFDSDMPECSYFFLDEAPFCLSVVDGFDLKFLCFQTNAGNFTPFGMDCLSTKSEEPEGLPSISLRPNPAEDWLNVDASEALRTDVRQTIIFDPQGRVLYTHQGPLPGRIDIAALPPGIYLLCVKLENGQQATRRFVKR